MEFKLVFKKEGEGEAEKWFLCLTLDGKKEINRAEFTPQEAAIISQHFHDALESLLNNKDYFPDEEPAENSDGLVHLSLSKTDFECPACHTIHNEKDYLAQWLQGNGLIYKKCKNCKTELGINNSGPNGSFKAWEKSKESTLEDLPK